jgi:hypothetical protein
VIGHIPPLRSNDRTKDTKISLNFSYRPQFAVLTARKTIRDENCACISSSFSESCNPRNQMNAWTTSPPLAGIHGLVRGIRARSSQTSPRKKMLVPAWVTQIKTYATTRLQHTIAHHNSRRQTIGLHLSQSMTLTSLIKPGKLAASRSLRLRCAGIA